MAITPGDFSASQLAEVLVRSDRMWDDQNMRPDFVAQCQTVNALRSEQNADVRILQDPEKDRQVKIFWANLCNQTASSPANPDDCDLGGSELGSDSKTYGLTQYAEYKFQVNRMGARTNELETTELVSKGFMIADKVICEDVSAKGHAFIEASKGTNTISDGIGSPNGTSGDTDIAAANWDEAMFAYLYRISVQNYINNPFLLSGSNLFEKEFVANASRANGEGKGAANLFNTFRTYYDLFNIDTLNGSDKKTYMINRGSTAFASKAYYGATPVLFQGEGPN